jgi:putative heme-binding domain-containing protein
MALLNAVAEGKIPRADISVPAARAISALKDDAVREKLAGVWGIINDSGKERQRLIGKHRKLLNSEFMKGADLRNGRVIYNRTCFACHQLYGEGGDIGPDLTGSNRADLNYILENIIDPNAAIGTDYQLSQITTKDGRGLGGIIAEETDKALVIKMANERITLSKDEIKERTVLPASMMPEGLITTMTELEIRDLIAYLATREQVELPEAKAEPQDGDSPDSDAKDQP